MTKRKTFSTRSSLVASAHRTATACSVATCRSAENEPDARP